MILQDAIKLALQTTGMIRHPKWLSGIHLYVENGFVRNEHNETQTGSVAEFDIELLMSDLWEIYYPEPAQNHCPFCGGRSFATNVHDILSVSRETIVSLKRNLDYNGFYIAHLLDQLSEDDFQRICEEYSVSLSRDETPDLYQKVKLLFGISREQFTSSDLSSIFRIEPQVAESILNRLKEERLITDSSEDRELKIRGWIGGQMSAQAQIVKFLEYMKIPIEGHVHERCNLGNCAYLQIDFRTPKGLTALGNALEMFMRSHKGGETK